MLTLKILIKEKSNGGCDLGLVLDRNKSTTAGDLAVAYHIAKVITNEMQNSGQKVDTENAAEKIRTVFGGQS